MEAWARKLIANLDNEILVSAASVYEISLKVRHGKLPEAVVFESDLITNIESRLGYTRFSQTLGINNKIDPKSLGIDTGPLGAADFGIPYVYMYHLGYGG